MEKISKLILGEIRQIRQIIEMENCQVSPTELPTTVETLKNNSSGGNFSLLSSKSNGVASSAVLKNGTEDGPSCNFERRDISGDLDVEEKLRADPEVLFCCCSWPRTRLL